MVKKVSIIMGIYNCEKTLAETLDSILNQSYGNWELIMCDDGSTDNSFKIAKDYSSTESRMKLLIHQKNNGLAKTLNDCLECATGEYIMRHDADDLMVKNRIEKQVLYMNQNICDACGSGAFIFDESGIWGLRQPKEIQDKYSMIKAAPFIHPTVIMKRSVLNAVGGYSDNNLTRKRLEDYDLWIKLFEKEFILRNIQEPLIYFREDRDSYTRKKRLFRLIEMKARLNACKRLKVPHIKRIGAFKPLLVMILPKGILRKHHINKSIVNLKNEQKQIEKQ
ncbi:Putative glycosyltransferase EpsE [Paenibacillus auburnensis]|uniref:Glycosyltransferase EpsE n=1 Tax=Paenibacillus auburnensis TaxID=2905649 RepID=A0ABM9CX04_9BACL|nr:glycosyltransferase [Paenibacillus auburnensis]CAH1225173.1 Putative glycosyltransferase EpsE [Paenibacillus auburnensis]